MTQVELAARARIAQSVVSAYESGRREPGFETVNHLLASAGFTVDLVLTPAVDRSPLRVAVDKNRSRLTRELRKLGARRVRLFGSVARGEDGPQSDIDLLVDVDAEVGLFALGRMRAEAERILHAVVDIVPANSLKPDVAERVLAEAITL
jgi:predicted nucleotidyltransferase